MRSAPSLHRRGQIKGLPTAGNTVKQISDVVKRSKKAVSKYGTKKSSGRPSKLNNSEKKEILRTASYSRTSINEIGRTCGIYASETTVWRTLDKCPKLTQEHNDERLCWARIFMRCD
uniref:HTH_Tnp_Tc3_2 domain-containing protein n=1 Tax=Heterorhabditis bacteriophora TaxID=37862 RepID=A0A1I7WAJ5_HETBA